MGVQFQERFTHSLSQVTNPLIITKGKTYLARCQTEYDSGTRIQTERIKMKKAQHILNILMASGINGKS